MLHGEASENIGAILHEARSEAKDSFGIDTVFLEKFLPSPKHIEVQILADKHGNVVHLLERDCTIQRKHQKIIEIAPAVSVPYSTRQRMHEAAVQLAKHVKYGAYLTACPRGPFDLFTYIYMFTTAYTCRFLLIPSTTIRKCSDSRVFGPRR